MSKPVPGKPYTVKDNDTLWNISARAYGDPYKYTLIEDANPSLYSKHGTGFYWPGDIIMIPVDAAMQSVKNKMAVELTDKAPDEFTLIIAGKEIPVSAGKVVRLLDSMADGWTATLPLNYDTTEAQEAIRPYSYADAVCYLGGKRVITGRLYSTVTNVEDSSRSLNLAGWSYAADLIDCTLDPKFYQAKKINLNDRATQIIKPFGFPVVYESKDVAPFRRVKATKTETVFDHLNKLARQRGVVLSSTIHGEPLFIDPTEEVSIGTLEEGRGFIKSFSASFDGRMRWRNYKAIASGPRKHSHSTAVDNGVPVYRTLTFSANDTEEGDIKTAADFRRNKKILEALSIPLPVSTWYAPDGELWRENTIITVVSKTLFLEKGFDFLIRKVEFDYSDQGTTAVLTVVPPSALTRGELIDPWSGQNA